MILPIAAGLLILFGLSKNNDVGGTTVNTRLHGLPDIDPADQGGKFKKDYDFEFESAADKFGVPFALLKAHAFRESSLNPKAFRDENPKKRTDRVGWASRGLMQLLFWPDSTRFEQYGFKRTSNPDDLYIVSTNIEIAAQLIRDNLKMCSGNVRDAINMYNTGVKEKVRAAPENYVNNVLSTYETLIKGKVV